MPEPMLDFHALRKERYQIAHDMTRATYAIPQPLLCAEMPHRFAPVKKSASICLRCGVSEGVRL